MVFKKTKIMILAVLCLAMQDVFADAVSYYVPPAEIVISIHTKLVLRYPKWEAIELRKNEIRRDLLVAYVKRCGVQTLGVIGAVLACCRGVKWLTGPSNIETVTHDWSSLKLNDESMNKIGEALVALQASHSKLEQQKALVSTLEKAKVFGLSMAELLVNFFAAQVIWSQLSNYLTQELFHPDHGSVKWFASKKVALIPILEELKQYVMVLDRPVSFSESNEDVHEFYIVSSINSLVIHMESIIAFIEYKNSLVTGGATIEIAQTSRYLFNIMDKFCNDVESLLAQGGIGSHERKKKMESFIEDLRTEITRIIISFARIEAEKGV